MEEGTKVETTTVEETETKESRIVGLRKVLVSIVGMLALLGLVGITIDSRLTFGEIKELCDYIIYIVVGYLGVNFAGGLKK
jgi:hypothetical protein